jgi:hypothetical protein
MANIVSHIVIAGAVLPEADPDYLLGSALPDFVSMAKDFRGSTVTLYDLKRNSLFEGGIAIHQSTDGIYDHLPEKTQFLVALRSDLEKTDLSRGAIKSCSKAGTDILLDGILVECGYVPAYNYVSDHVNHYKSAISTVEDIEFVRFVRDYFIDFRPLKYRDPEAVATMLQHRIALRQSRYSVFPEESITPVAEALATQRQRLIQNGRKLIDLTVAKLKSKQ